MNLGVLFSLLVAHLLSDFIFQSSSMAQQKQSQDIKTMLSANLKHSIIHGIISTIVLLYYFWTPWIVLVIAMLFISHFIVDIVKSYLVAIKRPGFKYSSLIFIIDQILHFIILLIISSIVSRNIRKFTGIEILVNRVIQYTRTCSTNITYGQKLIVFLALILIGLWGIGIFIRIFVEEIEYKPYRRALNKKIFIANDDNNNGVQNGGFLIGILERMIIICAVVTDMTQIIGFLVATKSIARFKKFDDDKFVEYFIIGSFISIFSAIVIGLLIRSLNIFPIE